ncbi:hypothetical protein HHI36_011576 [Cryptolaemus montrouzieri]|uniref:Uncharacterized protein n=1 Tax=Cryptolaemus montrouzieri TaxID=559131 RepID=A0ABD2MM84_9CUCU
MVYGGGKSFSKGKKRSIFEIHKYEDTDRTQKIRGGKNRTVRNQRRIWNRENIGENLARIWRTTCTELRGEYGICFEQSVCKISPPKPSTEKTVNEYVQLNQVSAKQWEQYLTELYNNDYISKTESENDSERQADQLEEE